MGRSISRAPTSLQQFSDLLIGDLTGLLVQEIFGVVYCGRRRPCAERSAVRDEQRLKGRIRVAIASRAQFWKEKVQHLLEPFRFRTFHFAQHIIGFG